jgi:glycosyltransferase involved in cell wall biosynthesis
VGSGYETWRKGKDLFVQLAFRVRQLLGTGNVHFLWVGGQIKGEEYQELSHDIKMAGLDQYVHFCGEVSNPLDYFSASDVFVLLSREDPYPLVCLEAAILGKPVLCFDNAGGMPEFVENDAGFIVPYLDMNAMADKVIELLHDKSLREKIGERAAQKVQERHTVSVAAPQIVKVINQFMDL